MNFRTNSFRNFDQFSHLSFEIRGFSSFNQILLGLFDVSYAFQVVFELFILLTHFHFNIKSNTIMKRA